MELDDLAKHETSFVEPISYTFQNEVTLYECPPNGQGITALLALGILENMEAQGKIKSLLEMEHNSTEYLHALVEALRLALRIANITSQTPTLPKSRSLNCSARSIWRLGRGYSTQARPIRKSFTAIQCSRQTLSTSL